MSTFTPGRPSATTDPIATWLGDGAWSADEPLMRRVTERDLEDTWTAVGVLARLAHAAGRLQEPAVLDALIGLERAHPAVPHWTGLLRADAPPGLEAMIARADADGLPLFIETTTPAAAAAAAPLALGGFRTLASVQLPRGGPRVTALWRPAHR